jgi:hypothetical protein
MASPGNAIVLTVRNQGGKCTQCIVDDVTVRGNTLTNNLDGYAVNILGYDDGAVSQQTQRITIDRNLFADAPGGIQIINGVATALVITNNTMPKIAGKFLQWDKSARPKVMTPLTFSRNVLHAGAYGIMGDGSTGPRDGVAARVRDRRRMERKRHRTRRRQDHHVSDERNRKRPATCGRSGCADRSEDVQAAERNGGILMRGPLHVRIRCVDATRDVFWRIDFQFYRMVLALERPRWSPLMRVSM